MGTLMAKDLLKLKPPQLTVLPIEQSFMWLRALVLMQGNEHVGGAKPNDGGRWRVSLGDVDGVRWKMEDHKVRE